MCVWCVNGSFLFRGVGEQINTQDNPDVTLDDEGFPNWVHGTSRIPDDVLRAYIIYARCVGGCAANVLLADCTNEIVVNLSMKVN